MIDHIPFRVIPKDYSAQLEKVKAQMGLKKDPRYIQSLQDKIRGWKL